ncbi:MAG: hypothetical protein LBL84_01755 [Candidatus Nomurabacteria bacterium]|jgi:hypothetical protein|nr:hypothetical protein [Candidatus Nomurabacteria bacterium]
MDEAVVKITKARYDELLFAEKRLKHIKSVNSRNAKAGVGKLTPEQLSSRAKKAVQARIAKYGQKSSANS